MLSLPEFIREGVPEGMQLKMQMEDPKALLSLPDFIREPVPERLTPQGPPPTSLNRKKSFKGLRSRSMSAPPLAWLLNSSSPRSGSPSIPETPETPGEKEKKEKEPRRMRLSRSKRPGSSSGITPSPSLQGQSCASAA